MTDKVKPIALCPGCSEPLISTFAFTGYEFLCICCGRKVTYFGPDAGDGEDERLLERLAELKAEFEEKAGRNLLPHGRFWLEDCEKCVGDEDHWQHVTHEERLRDEEAREWLKERTMTYRTKTGRVLTNADFEALADEAERGYDIEHLKKQR